MIRAIAFGLGAGAGIQAWRQWPPDGNPSSRVVIVASVLAMVIAYYAGKARRGGNATAAAVAVASADATAVAHQTVQIAVVTPGQGARPVGISVPEDAPWMLGPRVQVSGDDLDGMSVEDRAELADG